jgi:alpha-N-acetylglucosamine transferase
MPGSPRLASTFNKLHAWRLVDFDRVLVLDCDLLLLEPIDALFRYPAPGAVAFGPLDRRFNSGVLLIGLFRFVSRSVRVCVHDM